MKCLIRALLCASALAAAATAAQDAQPDRHARAIAAGYKALTLCSGLFNAGRDEAQLHALELKGIYPEYEELVHELEAHIDRDHTRVSVAFDDALPARIAAWRPGLGCTQLPIGADLDAVATLPNLAQHAPRLDDAAWPMGDRQATARVRGDAAALRRAIDAAFTGEHHGARSETTAVVVLQQGRIVGERYRDGFGPHVSQRTWSVAKSLSGTLIGVAAGEGRLDPHRPAAIAAWQAPGDPRAAITIDQLLRMSSGLHSDTAGNRTDALYFGGATVDQEVVSWPLLARPGTQFRYANNDTVLAVRAVRETFDDQAQALAYPFTALLWRIGITRTAAETDWRGNFVLSSQVWSTARDLARWGVLMQDDGEFAGQRVLPAGWVKYMTTPSGPQPTGGDFGYGATVWLLARSPGVPADAFGAFGNRGQYVIVIPSRRVVIVRRGEDPSGARFDIAGFTAQVLAALD